MVDFDIDDPESQEAPHDSCSQIKVWSEDRNQIQMISLYYSTDEAPDNTRELLQWERQHAIEYVDFEATGAKVEETLSYVDNGFGGKSYYA